MTTDAMTVERAREIRDRALKVLAGDGEIDPRTGMEKGTGFTVIAESEIIALCKVYIAAREQVPVAWVRSHAASLDYSYLVFSEAMPNPDDGNKWFPLFANPPSARIEALIAKWRAHGGQAWDCADELQAALALAETAPKRIAELEAIVARLQSACESSNYELAALIPKPSAPEIPDWPCENEADRRCLQIAYTDIRKALGLGIAAELGGGAA